MCTVFFLPKNTRTESLDKKLKTTIVLDAKSVLLFKYLQKRTTITVKVCGKTIQNLKKAIGDKQQSSWGDKTLLWHYNCKVQKTRKIATTMQESPFMELLHPPYMYSSI